MYRPRYFRWKMLHVLSILAHLGLVCGGSVAYVYNNVGRQPSPTMQQFQHTRFILMTTADHEPCPFTLDGIQNWGAFNAASHTLLLTCIFVGVFGLIINVGMFCLLLAVEVNKVTLTEGQQHWRKQIVTFFACVLNLILAGAGAGLVGLLSADVDETKSLIAPLVLASIQAPLAVSTAIFDAIKNHREGKDLLD
ncbi:hypothetical protein QBC38DRAFT_375554 [Podospora fimiseda]|uniref:Uncharacterized protein n=1 Tax=Podospora fimiseda TaxID=252190 RepID=A0AAN7BGN4_9PEZI|nr:hypothetical protein QBC38DRAFT_375554 [Podospora fimiseda]